MFIKYLKITNTEGLIRNIVFHKGFNLIIDDTPSATADTGNNVGKTTLLRLIDFCFGADDKCIYTSNDGVVNQDVKDFLKDTEVEVELCLVESFDIPECKTVTIRRNFVGGRKGLWVVNGQKLEKKDFELAVQHALWGVKTDKPSFRQIISHSFRIDDLRLSQSLKTVHKYCKDVEYETLHLYMFGANIEDSERKVELSNAIKTDRAYKNRLEKNATISALRSKLALVEHQIEQLNNQKAALNLNPDFEADLDKLAFIKHQLSQLGMTRNNLQLRRSLIQEAAQDMAKMKSNANADQIATIYKQARAFNENIQHTFEELLHFHNEMLKRRADFITSELPELNNEIKTCNDSIAEVRDNEKALEKKLNLSVSYEAFDQMITKLNQCHQELGQLQQSISLIEEVEKRILANEELLKNIDDDLFSETRQQYVQSQLEKFNIHFATISERLYEESYAIEYKVGISREGKPCYKFSPFATDNFSTGKKQGEITCFDLAYILFADEEQIPCLHFVLNDKKELMSDNQLVLIADLVNEQDNVQYVASILRDKLPPSLDDNRFFTETLSMRSRLFKIEESIWAKTRQ